jgi:hypothetical protein
MKALKFTKDRREAFLRALADTGIVTTAAGVVGITRARAYQVRKEDRAFAAAWDEAEEKAADALEGEAWHRAVVGVPEPLVSAGKVVRDDAGVGKRPQKYFPAVFGKLQRFHVTPAAVVTFTCAASIGPMRDRPP